MKKILTYMAMVTAVLLTACSDDTEQVKQRVMVELVPCAPSYVLEEPITRGWIPPENFKPYTELNYLFDGQDNLVDNTIGIYFTQDGETPELGSFMHSGDDKWRCSMEINGGTYYLYGFIPYTTSASIVPDANTGKYSDGATLTLNGLPSVTASDVCVVVGAKNGKDDYKPEGNYSVSGLIPGTFEYVAEGGSGNYIYLLFDHLYAALRIQIKVKPEYNSLRTIKLKELYLEAYNENTRVKSKANVTVTLEKTVNGASPIANINFAYDNTSGDVEGLVFKNDEGTTLGTDYKNFRGSFVPYGISKFYLKSTYDVYDKNGNLVRPNSKATNVLDINQLFSHEPALIRGRLYIVNLTVNPTYLYMMSDPDLDNPTITIN